MRKVFYMRKVLLEKYYDKSIMIKVLILPSLEAVI